MTIIVPGDITLDGEIGLDDATYVLDLFNGNGGFKLPDVDENDKSTWYLKDLANVDNGDDEIELADATAILDLFNEDTKF